jgi:hypothetical protein
VNSICLKIPFKVLSTKIDRTGETETRVLSPFGIIDLTFRKTSNAGSRGSHFEIEVDGDTEHWIFYDDTITEFKTALLNFIWGVTQKYLGEEATCDFNELWVHVKGAEVNLRIPCGAGSAAPTNLYAPDDV